MIEKPDLSLFATLVFAHGGRILAEGGQSYAFNSTAGVETVQMIQRMAKNGCLL